MKKSIRLLAVIMSFVLLIGSVLPITASAVKAENSWEEYLKDGKGVYIGPGADDTEMYVTWYGGKDGVIPTVKVSEKADMSDAKVFEGTIHSGYKVERSNHVTVTGLEKGKTYYYVCCDGTTDTEVNSFKTVAEGAGFSAMYVSDIHIAGNSYEDESIRECAELWNDVLGEATSREDISLILSGGDQATEGQPYEYYGLFYPQQVKNIPFAFAQGNHDVKRYTYDAVANYPNAKLKGLSKSLIHGDYYFTKGDALFLVLDSTNSSATDHYFFVKNAVKENPDVKWKIMMFHHDLYGGHIESRESENMLLRLLFTPIIDRFQIDLVLTGHSHCFSRSHAIYRGKVTEDLTGKTSVTDPKGTIYLNNGSLETCTDGDPDEPIFNTDRKSEFVATDCISRETSIYNILSFEENSLTIKSYLYGTETPFTELTINKTTNEGGHPDKPTQLWFVIGKYIGTIYNMINNISRKGEIAERG